MKTKFYTPVFIIVVFLAGLPGKTQTVTRSFLPSLLTPDPAGFYISGYDKDEGGTIVHYDSCSFEFADYQHFESDTLDGFSFEYAIVMPTCQPKKLPSKVSEGYISIKGYRYEDTDSFQFGYVITPYVKDLEEIEIEVAPDNTPKTDRPIMFRLEYSADQGATWDNIYYIEDAMVNEDDKKGYIATFNATTTETKWPFEWEAMVAASEAGRIQFRVRTVQYYSDGTPYDNGEPDDARAQPIRVHKITLKAGLITGVKDNTMVVEPFFTLRGHTIEALKGEVSVYNMVGQLIGRGERVGLSDGVYIIQSEKGLIQKVVVVR